jgi:hypothetical protein
VRISAIWGSRTFETISAHLDAGVVVAEIPAAADEPSRTRTRP